ncbi:MAG: DNA alkylation repair protein [Bacteroidales bacterium]
MLKAASEHNPRVVFEYLIARRGSMPRTAYRYALEKMPPEWRAQAMKKE